MINFTKTNPEDVTKLTLFVDSSDGKLKFMGHDGFFDGVIAPNNVTPQELKVIANNNFVQLRELPIFVFGSAAVAKQRLTHIRADRITCVYRNNLRKELQAWTNTIAMSA